MWICHNVMQLNLQRDCCGLKDGIRCSVNSWTGLDIFSYLWAALWNVGGIFHFQMRCTYISLFWKDWIVITSLLRCDHIWTDWSRNRFSSFLLKSHGSFTDQRQTQQKICMIDSLFARAFDYLKIWRMKHWRYWMFISVIVMYHMF